MPVDGPPRITFKTTHGTSAIYPYPKFSNFNDIPGPLVAVSDLAPAREAPITAAIALISSSICINLPP